MTRGTRTTLILLIVLGGLITFVVYTNNNPKAEPTPAASTSVWDMSPKEIAAIQIVDNAEQKDVILERGSADAWRLSGKAVKQPPQPAATGQGELAASLVTTMSIRRTLTETNEIREFGLLTPLYTLNVTKQDGTKLSLAIGLKTLAQDGYYVLRPGDKNPMIVPNSSLDQLIGFIAKPPIEPTPTPTLTATPLGTPAATATPTATQSP
ncbi:MAG: DUF4340 domain-containing protein [Chloroflexi bacterium]|nr:DUF4340 domain-containing protein [Chloroflexota bacterium]